MNELEADLKRLEAEYNMFFAGRLPVPPRATRSRVEALIRQFDRGYIQNYGERFRFTTLQSRFATLTELWDRGLRAREEGRAGPFQSPRTVGAEARRSEHRVVRVAAFRDPEQEAEKLRDLYESFAEARREVGAESISFRRFAELVRAQVQKMRTNANVEVAFRVMVKDGNVNLTAKVLKAPGDEF